jgi:hypothetical protein
MLYSIGELSLPLLKSLNSESASFREFIQFSEIKVFQQSLIILQIVIISTGRSQALTKKKAHAASGCSTMVWCFKGTPTYISD